MSPVSDTKNRKYYETINTVAHDALSFCFASSDIDECLDSPCLHDGTCSNTAGSYECVCITGWSGNDCETGEINISIDFVLSTLNRKRVPFIYIVTTDR